LDFNFKQLQQNAEQLAENARVAAEDMMGSYSKRRPLYIPASQQGAEASTQAIEDMTIMGRILEKATSHDERKGRAMGIFIRMPSQGASRDMYIEGQGAVFFLNVGFPLAAAKTDKEEQTSAPPSEWDETKRELNGPQHSTDYGPWTARPEFYGPPVEFEREKVEDLETQLIAALTNAVHIQALKPNETITVVVTGTKAGGSPQGATFGGGGYGGGGFGYVPQRPLRKPNARKSTSDAEPNGTDVIKVPSQDEMKKGARIEVLHGTVGSSVAEPKLIIRARRKDLEKLASSNPTREALRQSVTAFIF
jgi:hypothetical protein